MSIEKKYKKLDDISHILQRSGMYVGSIKTHTDEKWIIEDGKSISKSITYNPAFLFYKEFIVDDPIEEKRKMFKLLASLAWAEIETYSVYHHDGQIFDLWMDFWHNTSHFLKRTLS